MGNSNESQIRMWATLLSLSMQAISSHHILMTNSMWAIVQFCLLSSFIICHPLANSMWVTLHHFSLCNVVSSHFMSWLTGGEWYSSFDGQNLSHLIPCPTDSEWHPLYNQVLQLIIPNDSMWVVLHFFPVYAVSALVIPARNWCRWHYIFSFMKSHYMTY